MILPTITLGGTSADALGQQALIVRERAEDLMQALRDAAPHGRDYTPTDFNTARLMFERRMEFLRDTAEYYLRVAEHAIEAATR
jgi:hypothetical protein